ncbi:MAG: PfkB family carbohydrate kinase, partial [Desulfurococcaceae archaeon]
MEARKYDIVTVGHALVDIRIVVDEFPGSDEEAPVIRQTWGGGGSAVNVAIDGSRLGLRTAIMAKIGFDSFGRIVVDELLREGVDISGLRVSSTGQTGFTIVVINRRGEIVMYGFKGVSEELMPDEISEPLISGARFVHVASLRKDTTLRAAEVARRSGAKVVWDPGRVLSRRGLAELADVVKAVDVVTLNSHEAAALAGTKPEEYREAAKAIKGLGPELVIVKRGERGVYALGEGFEG